MATSIKLNPIFSSLAITLFFLILHTQTAFSSDFGYVDEDEVYVLDHPVPDPSSRSKFLIRAITNGQYCSAGYKNICNRVSANYGESLLNCCYSQCRNILVDGNNCGKCGNKCRFAELCCNGSCINAFNNADHCGNCNKKCPHGVKCEYGACGYA